MQSNGVKIHKKKHCLQLRIKSYCLLINNTMSRESREQTRGSFTLISYFLFNI
jgi:hypothetical protein